VWTATATCTARAGGSALKGVGPGAAPVSARIIAERVSFLVAITHSIGLSLARERWTADDFATLTAGVDASGERLPAKAFMAARRLDWDRPAAGGLYIPDRVMRAGQEAGMRLLRSSLFRAELTTESIASYPRTAAGFDDVAARNSHRHVRAFGVANERLPADLFEMEPTPNLGAVALLAAGDKQLSTIERTSPTTALLIVKLPAVARPTERGHWVRHWLPLNLPSYIPEAAELCSPSLRLVDGAVRVDLPWRVHVVERPRTGHVTALGVDWGVNTLLTATRVRLHTDDDGRERVLSDGHARTFNTANITDKLLQLHRTRQHLSTKIARLEVLNTGGPIASLQSKIGLLTAELAHVSARTRNLNDAIARSAAGWLLKTAANVGATAIYVENLDTLETRARSNQSAKGRRGNARNSQSIRGKVFAAIEHQALRAGITVVAVHARNTSKLCPRCLNRVAHVLAPDRPVSGWKWSTCACGLSVDRDHASAERIGSRGLTAQQSVYRSRKTKTLTVSTISDVTVAPAKRRKARTGPTPSQRNTARRFTRRLVPALTKVSQRPAGRPSQSCINAASEVDYESLTAARLRHGHGFHNRVRATPITPTPGFGPNSNATPSVKASPYTDF
jgi:hypothetical protein